jgi:ribosome maturation factor RimP
MAGSSEALVLRTAGLSVRTTQDEELAVTERSAGLPSQKQVIELLDGEFARAGYEIEEVVIDASTRPPRITVIADGDEGLDLDSIAALSRSASELLDSVDSPQSGAPYVLEVTSPGVDRPLTVEKHYRRARGRKVELTLSDGSELIGRLGETRDGTVRLVVREGNRANYSVRELPLDGIAKAVVQVEFSPPNQRELELAGQTGKGAGA